MRKILFFLAMMAVPFLSKAQSALPEFSTEDAPVWYTIEFKTGGNFLTDKGSGNKMVTVSTADSFDECWMFIGDASGFKMKSRIGNYVCFKDSRFATTNDQSRLLP